MDILHLVDRLEELINDSRPIPFTRNVIVDEDRLLDIIDQMRVTVPDEVKKAQQILTQRDRIMAQAQEEANRTLALARDKGELMVDRDGIVQAAHHKADQVLSQIHAELQVERQEADMYIYESLSSLEEQLLKILNQVRNGIQAINPDIKPDAE